MARFLWTVASRRRSLNLLTFQLIASHNRHVNMGFGDGYEELNSCKAVGQSNNSVNRLTRRILKKAVQAIHVRVIGGKQKNLQVALASVARSSMWQQGPICDDAGIQILSEGQAQPRSGRNKSKFRSLD
jgi:hypothetical protein